jgi:hypothetical protein
MNAAFNMLDGSGQAQLLQMTREHRPIVMREIMRKSARQTGGIGIQQNQSNTPLEPYFNALPVDKQLTALHGGYNSMSKEFNSLAKLVPDSLIKITNPISVQDQLYGALPLLAVDQKDGKKAAETKDSESSSNTTSNESTSSSDSTVKKISFK